MESVGDDAKSVFHEDQKFFKSDTIYVTFEIGKCSESIGFDANNDLQEYLKLSTECEYQFIIVFQNLGGFVQSPGRALVRI